LGHPTKPAEVITRSSEEQLGQQLREKPQSHFIALRSTAETALRLGEILLRVKERIPIGRFRAWFGEQAQGRCGQRTAQLYMKLAREASRVREIQGTDAQNSTPLPVYRILTALSKPRDASPPKSPATKARADNPPKNERRLEQRHTGILETRRQTPAEPTAATRRVLTEKRRLRTVARRRRGPRAATWTGA
jgi:hypothetical protein